MQHADKILIVDDEEFNRELLEDMLDVLGYAHESARSGEEALSMLSVDTSLVLLDVMMPGMNGFQVVERIRQHPEHSDLPIILVTALNSKEDRLRAVDAGANDFIAKPVDRSELKVRTASVLKVKEAQDRIKYYQAELEATVVERTSQLNAAMQQLAGAQRRTYDGYLETIKRLAIASEYKDARTSLHLQRVSHYCAMLARAIGLPPRDVEILFQASAMHDVGKLGIPDEILTKAGLLTPSERARMQHHTTIGAAILGGSDSELLQAGEEIALSHHEKWDGTGYPHNLAGTDIPLFGRICAIADVFDALTSARAYKSAFDNAEAYEIIRAGTGSHFDPHLVDAFFANLEEVTSIQEMFPERDSTSGTGDGAFLAA